ncbi:MAG: NAD-dependent dehydratase, partial [Pseudomonadota bacterium]
HIRDSVRCIEIALANGPTAGDRVKIFNQMTETHRVRDLAELISSMTGVEINYQTNPRKEAKENELVVKNDQFLALGLEPTTLEQGLLAEIVEVSKKYTHRIDRSRVIAKSAWTKAIAEQLQAER